MRTVALLFILSAACAVSAEPVDASAKPLRYDLKNRSSFAVKTGSRVPFWPIGWSKEKPIIPKSAQPAVVAQKVFQIQPSHFTVTSVLLSNPPLATINGRAFGEGEQLPVTLGEVPLRVTVKAIRDGGVWLDQSGHQIFVPMRRQELTPRAGVDPAVAAPGFTIKIVEKPEK